MTWWMCWYCEKEIGDSNVCPYCNHLQAEFRGADFIFKQELIRRARRRFPEKEIRKQIAELRKDGKLPHSRKDYKPNIRGIQCVCAMNDSEVTWTMMHNKPEDGRDNRTYLNGFEILAKMLKEVILCDYHKKEYELPEPQTFDFLGIFDKTMTPSRVIELGLRNDKYTPKIDYFRQRKKKEKR